MAMRFLGIDPGTRLTGYALLDADAGGLRPRLAEAGVIRLKAKDELQVRLGQLYSEINDIIEEAKPDVMGMEDLYASYRNPRTAIVMGHARGVLMLLAEQHNMQLTSLTATTIKKSICGSGRAPKEQIQLAVQQQFGLKEIPDPPDIADAIAVASCVAQRWALQALDF